MDPLGRSLSRVANSLATGPQNARSPALASDSTGEFSTGGARYQDQGLIEVRFTSPLAPVMMFTWLSGKVTSRRER
ncbi:MAG: hypothetical protein DMG57_14155 [Acidobacteria bacterium]|nr:MAG: hypothetical protein DMG57_14155 [Acidobacteriota bacterium]